MNKVIIGIHGLSNKPARATHKEEWIVSIQEGLACIGKLQYFEFSDVYWASLMHRQPLHREHDFYFDSLYDGEPYIKASPNSLSVCDDGLSDFLRAKTFELVDNISGIGKESPLDKTLNYVLAKRLQDLAFYYDPNKFIMDRNHIKGRVSHVLRTELQNELLMHENKEIMLITHSMGSIIAYDVLRDLGQTHPKFEVQHFVTLGSPLGLPYVQERVEKERAYDPVLRTPSIVTESWKNFADRQDPIAFDSHLYDDFSKNKRGVAVKDDLINNTYKNLEGRPNHHKIFGYLRAPEVAEHIARFLES